MGPRSFTADSACPSHQFNSTCLPWRNPVEPGQVERDNFLEKEAGKLDVKAWLEFKTFRMWRLASEAFSCARCPNEPTIWINETDCAKSLADLKTSYCITRGQVANKLRFSRFRRQRVVSRRSSTET